MRYHLTPTSVVIIKNKRWQVWRRTWNPVLVWVDKDAAAGKQKGGSSNTWKENCYLIQQSHFWVVIPPKLKSGSINNWMDKGNVVDIFYKWNIIQPLKKKEILPFFSPFLGLHLGHVEVPRLGVKSRLQLPAYATATATEDPSRACDLRHSLSQRQICSPLSQARDWTCDLMDTSWAPSH